MEAVNAQSLLSTFTVACIILNNMKKHVYSLLAKVYKRKKKRK